MAITANSQGSRITTSSLPGHPTLRCVAIDEDLIDQLIARTLDPGDDKLQAMTHDLERFSSRKRFDLWSRERDIVCLVDADDSLLGVVWIGEKPMPDRGDYFKPETIRENGPKLTWAIRLYGHTRGMGISAEFSEHALVMLTGEPGPQSLWYETRACNSAARTVATQQLGFDEVSGEAGGTVVGARWSPSQIPAT